MKCIFNIQMSAKNIQEYVVQKIIEYLEQPKPKITIGDNVFVSQCEHCIINEIYDDNDSEDFFRYGWKYCSNCGNVCDECVQKHGWRECKCNPKYCGLCLTCINENEIYRHYLEHHPDIQGICCNISAFEPECEECGWTFSKVKTHQ